MSCQTSQNINENSNAIFLPRKPHAVGQRGRTATHPASHIKIGTTHYYPKYRRYIHLSRTYLSETKFSSNIFGVLGCGIEEASSSSAEHLDGKGLDLLLQ